MRIAVSIYTFVVELATGSRFAQMANGRGAELAGCVLTDLDPYHILRDGVQQNFLWSK